MKNQITSRDYKLLSAYLDNQLTAHERARLESRINLDPALQQELHELGKTRSLLRAMPRLRAPRNYFVTGEAIQRSPEAHPFLRLAPAYAIASAIATILLVMVIFGNILISSSSPAALAPASIAPTELVELVQEVELREEPTLSPVEAAPLMMMEAPEYTVPPPSANLKMGGTGLATPTTIYLDAMLPTSTPEGVMSVLEEGSITATISCEEYYLIEDNQIFPLSSICPTPTSSPSNFLESIQTTTSPTAQPTETPPVSQTVTPTHIPSTTPTPTTDPTEASASLQQVAPESVIEVPLMPAPSEMELGAAYPAPTQMEPSTKPGPKPNFEFIQYLVLSIELSLAAVAILAGLIAIILRIRAGR